MSFLSAFSRLPASRRLALVTMVGVALLGSVGCRQILGISDHDVVADGGEAADGTTGEGGTPDGAADGPGTSSDSGRDSGSIDVDAGPGDASASDAADSSPGSADSSTGDAGTATVDSGTGDSSTGTADSGTAAIDSGPCSSDLQTDGHNCGSCGHDCLGGACSAGTCQPVILASGLTLSGAEAIAVDSTWVYWTDKGEGTVAKVALTGGTAVPVASGQSGPSGIAAGSGNVYWADHAGSIMVSADGGPATPFASGQINPTGVAVDALSVYWTGGAGTANGPIMKAPLDDGGAPVVLVTGLPYQGFAIKVDSVNVYFTSPQGLFKVAIDGSTPAVTLAPTPTALDMAIDSTNAYWTGAGVMAVPLDGGTVVPFLTSIATSGIAADPSGVYCTESSPDAGAIVRVPTDGGAALPLASGQANPTAIAVDSVSIYWINASAGTVMRLAK